MLKTLLKYEWKDTWGLCTACNGIALILSVIGSLMVSFWHYSDNKSLTDTQSSLLSIGFSFYVVIYIVSVFAILLVMKYYFFLRYYKNLFTDQGYLMNTLPVKSTDLINSKLIIAVLWQFVTGIVVGICMVMIIFSFADAFGEFSITDFKEAFRDIEMEFGELVKGIPVIVSSIISGLVAPVFEILLMYMAVGIGQQSKKNRLFLSIMVLIGLYMGKRFVSPCLSVPLQMLVINEEPSLTAVNVGSVLVALAIVGMTVGLYLLNKYFLEKKLNLE